VAREYLDMDSNCARLGCECATSEFGQVIIVLCGSIWGLTPYDSQKELSCAVCAI
jgi:hypothetical protein